MRVDSNHRGVNQQIYSLPPLTAQPHTPRAEGIEPPFVVLKTTALPLDDAPPLRSPYRDQTLFFESRVRITALPPFLGLALSFALAESFALSRAERCAFALSSRPCA